MPSLHIRRATVDDLPALRQLWELARLPVDELTDRLTEFQVVEADGQFAGAIGLQIVRQHARLHSEDYVDFSVADAAREAVWQRLQSVSAHHGVFRLWTQDHSPFWVRWGFQPASAEVLERRPAEWAGLTGTWLTYELKDEAAINQALGNTLAGFLAEEKQQTAQLADRAKKLNLALTIFFFTVGGISLSIAIWMLMHRSLTVR